MKKVALVFVLAVLVPSLLLAWLAVRSLRDQQFLLERQQSLLDQHVTDTLAQNISDYLAQRQQEFSAQVESMAAAGDAQTLAANFDDELRKRWPLAEVGFAVTAGGKILAPQPNARPAAQMFRLDNSGFLGNRAPVEVYLAANNANGGNIGGSGALNSTRSQAGQSSWGLNIFSANNSATRAPDQPQQQLKLEEQSGVPNPSAPSQSLAIDGNVSGGGASNLSRNQPNTLGMLTAEARTNSNLAAAPQGQELATADKKSDAPFSTVANVTPQAFTLSDSAAKNSASGLGNRSSSPPVGSYAGVAGNLAQSERQQSKIAGKSDSAKSAAPSQYFAADGVVAGGAAGEGFGGAANNFDRQASNVSTRASNLVLPDSASAAPQPTQVVATAKELEKPAPEINSPPRQTLALDEVAPEKDVSSVPQYQNTLNYKAAQSRKVSPQSQMYQSLEKSKAESATDDAQDNLSRVVPAEAEFRQLIGDQRDGMLARFLQNKLKLMCWHRLNAQPDLIFGAQLNLNRVVDGLSGLVHANRSLGEEICVAVLDDNAKPVVLSQDKFQANWKRPFVATEVGDALPHWEVAAYLINPAQLTQAAQTAKLTLGLLIAVLVVAIGIGSLLIVRGLEAELKLARQKTDFVSNVSHELKTPLTSIRMFSELLAEGRVTDHAKQRSYLQIISAEAARLTRLINNVLDFSRMERGEKKYNFQPCDLTDIVRSAAETFRPHLEGSGFQFACELPAAQIPLRGDADALSQVVVNLLSNAEKYSGQPERRSSARGDSVLPANDEPGRETGAPLKEIALQVARRQSPLPHVEVRVLDRGPGVPRGSEEKIFEKFYRAHDSLSSGIQGSGLGLTIARQIARAHGGDVTYESREGGGSCFILRLPILATDALTTDERR